MHSKQAGERYTELSKKEKDHLIDNIAQSLMFVDERVQKKVVEHLKNANQEMGLSVERELFLEL